MGELWRLIFERPPTRREMELWEDAIAASDAYFDLVGNAAPCPSCMVRLMHQLVSRRQAG